MPAGAGPTGCLAASLLETASRESSHLALVRVQAHVRRGKADLLAGSADDGLVVDLGLGGDFAEHHDHVGLGAGLAGNLLEAWHAYIR